MKKVFFLLIVFAFVSCHSGSNKSNLNDTAIEPVDVVEATINISGMYCNNCVASVGKGVTELDGVASVVVSLNDSNAIVKFDASKTNLTEIKKAIEKRGYSIKEDGLD